MDYNDNGNGILSGCDSDNNNNNIAIHDILPNPTESNTDSMDNKPPGESDPPAEVEVPDSWCNYHTLSRWNHRLSLWKEYMKIPYPKELPDAKEYLFSIPPDNDFAHLIWGDGEDSLKSRFREAKNKQAELEYELPQMESALEELKNELCQLESKAKELKNDLSQFEVPSLDTCKDEEPDVNPTLANSTMSSEKLETRRLKEALLECREDTIKSIQSTIKWKEESIKARGGLNTLERIIEDRQHIIEDRLGRIVESHKSAWTALISLDVDEDRDFLPEPLEKEDIVRNRELIFELQTFVADLLENADVASNIENKKDVFDEQIKATVDAILRWTPGTTVESLGPLNGRFICPPFNGCVTLADQPILCALIIRIMAILGPSCLPVNSEHLVAAAAAAAAETTEEGCWFDCVVDDYRDCFEVLFPGMLGRVIMVKKASQDSPTAFKKYQRTTRAHVIEHLAQRLRFAFNFGGIGHDDVVSGVVLSMFSVQVLEMKLIGVGTPEVDIVFRQTAHVPLLGKRLVPENIHNAVAWDMGWDGVLLLASAILDLHRKSLFGSGSGSVQSTVIDDVTAAKYCSQHSQEHEHEHEHHSSCELQFLLGFGSFHHVVKHGERMFMKFPRSLREVQVLTREFKTLKKLNADRNTCIPMTMPWGVSVVNLSIRNEISQIKVLRMMGTVGHSLGSCCENKYLVREKDIHGVIQKVYGALEYAHSKDIVHMAVNPCNIIVTQNGKGFDVLLTGWGCSRFFEESISGFVGCRPYAHDDILGITEHSVLKPVPDFDFASLGFTWYHVIEGVIDWKFDSVSDKQLQCRRTKMESFLNKIGKDSADLVPKVRDIFHVQWGKKRRLL